MKRTLLPTLTTLAVLALASPALATDPSPGGGPKHAVMHMSLPVTELDAIALNGAAGTRTFTFSPIGYGRTVFYMSFDYTAQAGTINLTCTASPDGNVSDYQLTACSVSAGVCTLTIGAGSWTTASLSADTKYMIDAGLLGYRDMECVVTHGGTPGATDKITVIRDTVSE